MVPVVSLSVIPDPNRGSSVFLFCSPVVGLRLGLTRPTPADLRADSGAEFCLFVKRIANDKRND